MASPGAVPRVGFPNSRHTWQASRPAGGSPVPALVADVQGWLDTPPSKHGWSLVGDETSLQNAKRFESRNNGATANRPQLTLVYTPPQESRGGVDVDVPLPLWALGLLALSLGALMSRSAHSRGSARSEERHPGRQ